MANGLVFELGGFTVDWDSLDFAKDYTLFVASGGLNGHGYVASDPASDTGLTFGKAVPAFPDGFEYVIAASLPALPVGSFGYAFDVGGNNAILIASPSTPEVLLYAGGGLACNTPVALGPWLTLDALFLDNPAGDGSLTVNGGTPTTGSPGGNGGGGGTKPTIGNFGGFGLAWPGPIGPLVFCNAPLDDDERTHLDAYIQGWSG